MTCAYTCLRTDPTKTIVLRPAMVKCYHCLTVERKEMEFLEVSCRSVDREWMEYKPLPGSTVCPTSRGNGPFGIHFLEIREITGVADATVPCGSRCQEAVGAECRCSCNSANHGVGHSLKE